MCLCPDISHHMFWLVCTLLSDHGTTNIQERVCGVLVKVASWIATLLWKYLAQSPSCLLICSQRDSR